MQWGGDEKLFLLIFCTTAGIMVEHVAQDTGQDGWMDRYKC